jgi:hypothetical protein
VRELIGLICAPTDLRRCCCAEALADEWQAGTENDRDFLDYILNQPIQSTKVLPDCTQMQDVGRKEGGIFADFCLHDAALSCGMLPVMVLALRLCKYNFFV